MSYSLFFVMWVDVEFGQENTPNGSTFMALRIADEPENERQMHGIESRFVSCSRGRLEVGLVTVSCNKCYLTGCGCGQEPCHLRLTSLLLIQVKRSKS